MSNNILSDSIGVNDIEENGSMSMKEIENTSNIKNESDNDKYNLPFTFNSTNPANNIYYRNDSESDDAHYSLLKELEDKWSFIERNKKVNKRNFTEVYDSKSFNTNSISNNGRLQSLQNWKSVIEESRKKYLMRKEKEKENQDFENYVKEKSKQLKKITNNYKSSMSEDNQRYAYRNNKNFNNRYKEENSEDDYVNDNFEKIKSSRNNKNNKKTFLKPENEIFDLHLQKPKNKKPILITYSPEAKVSDTSISIQNNTTINNTSCNKLHSKIKNIFTIITENPSVSPEKSKSHYYMTTKNNLSISDLNKNFSKVMEQLSPSIKNRSVISYSKQNGSKQGKYVNFRTYNKIKENKTLIDELLPKKTIRANYNSYFTKSSSYKTPFNSFSYSYQYKNPKCFDKNNFASTEKKLFIINSPTIGKIIKGN